LFVVSKIVKIFYKTAKCHEKVVQHCNSQ